jgi:nucleoside-diphosphate-sugar epimerase
VRILLIGGNGFIGTPLSRELINAGQWEQANPPTGATFHQFDYPAEDAALGS